MSVYEKLVGHVFYPLWMRRDGRGNVLRYKQQFQQEWMSSSWSELQSRRLGDLLKHCVSSVPFYRQRVALDHVALTAAPAKVIQNWPVLSKELVNKHGHELVSEEYDIRQLLKSSTGGSTGTPMRFWRTNECIAMRKAQEMIFDAMMGYRPGMRLGLFVSAAHTTGMVSGIKQRIRNATCERMLRFDPNQPNKEYLAAFQHQFERHRPSYIRCFPNSLVLFAEYAQARGLKYDFVRGISVTGENLYEWQRRLFEDVFDAVIYERYATKECGVIAGKTDGHDSMRIFTPGVFVEVLDANNKPCKDGEIGRLVVTDLFNEAMPLVRYDVGDLGAVENGVLDDALGNVPRLGRLLGRDRDIIVDSNGAPRPGYVFVEMVGRLNTNAQFQFVQESRHRLVINTVASAEESHVVDHVRQGAQEIVGSSVDVVINPVGEIPRDPSGKFSYVISKLSHRERIAALRDV